jgi:serine protein kinase
LQDRIILVKVPYNLRVSQEERIYDKLLHQSEALRNVHLGTAYFESRGDVCRDDAP